MSKTIRIILLIAIATVFGFAVTHFSIWAMGTTVQEYGTYFGTTGDGIAYYPLTIIFSALGLAPWLDLWLGTELLAE